MQPLTPRSAPCVSHDRFRPPAAPINANGKRGLHHRLVRPHTYSDNGGGGEYLFARPSPPPRPPQGSPAESPRAKRCIGNGDRRGGAYRSAGGNDERSFGDNDRTCTGSGGPGWEVLVQGTDEYPRYSSPFPRVTEGERLAALLDGAWWYGNAWVGNTTNEPASRLWSTDEGLSSGEEWFVDHDGGQGFDHGRSGKQEHSADQNVGGDELWWAAGENKNRRNRACNERRPQQVQNPLHLRESPSGFVALPHHTNTACQLPGVEPTRNGGGWRRCSTKLSLAQEGAVSARGRGRHLFGRHGRIGGGGGGDSNFACRDSGGRVESFLAPRRKTAEARRRQRKRPRWDARFYVTTTPNNVAAEVHTRYGRRNPSNGSSRRFLPAAAMQKFYVTQRLALAIKVYRHQPIIPLRRSSYGITRSP